MTPFNPPRKQATVALVEAIWHLAGNSIHSVWAAQNADPSDGAFISYPQRKLRDSTMYLPGTIKLLAAIVDAIGVDGRQALVRWHHLVADYLPFELTENQGDRWTLIADFPVGGNCPVEGSLTQTLVIHYNGQGKMAYDVSMSRNRHEDIRNRRSGDKKLTVEQLRRGYRAYIVGAGKYLKYDPAHATLGPTPSNYEMSRVLGGLDARSLYALLEEMNSDLKAHRNPSGWGIEQYRLTILEEMVTNVAGRDDDNAWQLVKFSPGCVDYVVVRDASFPFGPVKYYDRKLRNCQLLAEQYLLLRNTAIQQERNRHD